MTSNGKVSFPASLKSGNGALAILFAVLLTAFGTMHVSAQITTGDILGTVSDASGNVVANASVTVQNLGTHDSRTLKTDGGGQFSFNLLSPGHYSVAVEASSFKSFKIGDLNLIAGDRARADAQLAVGDATETITVEAASAILQTDSSVLSHSIVEQAVQDMPLNGRNYVQMAVVMPGSTEGSPNSLVGGNQPDDRRPSSAVSVNGEPEILNNFLVDGMDNNERLIGTQGVRPSIDAIDELRILTNSYTADAGRTGGGVINIITKSGSDKFHGTVYEFFRNDKLNTNAYAFGAHIPKPELRQNQFGGSIGGPVIRGRTFFFGDYENLRSVQGTNPTSYVVPTLYEEQHIGDFSDVGGPVLTAAQLDPIGVDYFSLYPAPNSATNRFVASDKITQINHTFDVRVDHHLKDRDLLFARYSFNHTDTANAGYFPTKTIGTTQINPSSGYGLSPSRAFNAALSYLHTFSPNLLLQLQSGYTHVENRTLPQSYTVNANAAFGQPGENVTPGLAQVAVSSASTLGISGVFVPLRDLDNIYQFMGTLTYNHGIQSMKFGAGLIRRQVGNYQSSAANGSWSFTTLPNLLQGNFASVSQNAALTTIRPRIWEPSVYFQDDVRITKSTTVNAGLRYDVYTPYTDPRNQLSNFDPTAGKIIIAGQNGVSATANVKTDRSNLAPRLGFSTILRQGMVIRGAFGMTFFPSNVTSTSLLRNAPFIGTFGPCTPATCTGGITKLAQGVPALIPMSVTTPVGSILATPFNFRQTYLYQYNLTFQQSMGANVLSVSYVGSLGRHLPQRIADINAPPLNTTKNYQPLRPYYNNLPGVTTIGMFQTTGSSNYNALQVVLERRFHSGLAYGVNDTWSHNLDNSNSYGAGCGNIGYDSIPSQTSKLDYGNACIDLRNRFSATANYELPFGKSLHGIEGALLKGWQGNVLGVWSSGQPFTVANVVDVGGTRPGVTAGDRPNQAHRPAHVPFSLKKAFDTTAFVAQPAGTYGAPAGSPVGTIGTLAERKGQLFGPHFRHFDLSLFKTFPIHEKVNLQFRAEVFNVANTTNFNTPNALLGSGPYGTITATSPLYTPRQFQFALKAQF